MGLGRPVSSLLREELAMHPRNRDVVIPYPGPGLSCGVREALADPIVQALLAADGVDPRDVADLARRMAARLSLREANSGSTAC
jgi:hypothetical protein